MSTKSTVKDVLIEMSVLPFMFIGVMLCIGLLYVLVLRPFGIPAAPEESAHSMKFMLEMILGLPVILITACAGLFAGILLWSIFVNLLPVGHNVEHSLQKSRTRNVHYKALLLWGLNKTKFWK